MGGLDELRQTGCCAAAGSGCFDYAVSSNGSFSVAGVPAAMSGSGVVLSDRCGSDDLCLPYDPGGGARAAVNVRPGWAKRWSTCGQVAEEEVVVPAGDLASAPRAVCEPVRRFGWYP